LEYHLSRLSSALQSFTHLGLRTLYSRQHRAELLAQIDALLAQIDGIRELAGHAREALLRPAPDDKAPGFSG
jgi:hypothetical protein